MMDKIEPSITIDAEDLFNRFYGVPLATIDDIYSICTLNEVKITLWMSKKERNEQVLFESLTDTTADNQENQFQQVCSIQTISIDDSRPTNLFMWIAQFYRVFKKDRAKVLYLTHFPAINFSGAKKILRVHDPFGSESKAFKELLKNDVLKHKIARALRTYAFTKNLTRFTIVANSEFTASQFSNLYKIPLGTIQIVPYGFRTYTLETIEKFRNSSQFSDPYYLMICGMRGNKRPDIVIIQWAEHASRLPRLVVIGKVPRQVLSSSAQKYLNSGHLEVVEFADELSLLEYKMSANAMIFASEYEGFGRPIIEALICGVPSIANTLDVFHEIGNEYVDFFSLDHPNSLIPLLEKYIHPVDLEYSALLVAFAQKYSYTEIGKKWRDLICD
jgi:glycosyltransferase involved in cell wall biosynthesis